MRAKCVVGMLAVSMLSCGELRTAEVEKPVIGYDEYRARFVEWRPSLGGWLVEGDVLVESEQEIHAQYLKSISPPEPGRRRDGLTVITRNGADVLWPKPIVLSYCVSADLSFYADAVDEHLRTAAQSWSDVIDVRFENRSMYNYANCGPSTDVTFEVRKMPSPQTGYAIAFWPDQPRSARKLYFSDVGVALIPGQSSVFQAVVRHELGHILGFRHENLWTGCGGETAALPPYDARLVTSLDPNSIMNSTQCNNITTQTQTDFAGATALYGATNNGLPWENVLNITSNVEPAAVGSYQNQVDLFVVDSTTNEVKWTSIANTIPSGQPVTWLGLGEYTTQRPAAVRMGAGGDLDLFVVSLNGTLRHGVRRGGNWQYWESLGTVSCGVSAAEIPGGGVVVGSCLPGARFTNVAAVKFQNGGPWSAWESPSGAAVFGPPQVAAWADGQIHFLARGKFSVVSYWNRANGVWSGSSRGNSEAIPALKAPYQGRLIGARVNGGVVSVESFNGSWATPIDLSGALLASGEASVTYVDGKIYVYAKRATDNAFYRNRVWNGAEVGWGIVGPRNYAGNPVAFTSAAAPGANASPFVVGNATALVTGVVMTRSPF